MGSDNPVHTYQLLRGPTMTDLATSTCVDQRAMHVVEVFADVGCPFTHVGLLKFVERRAAMDRSDVHLWIRPWPLEIVNGTPLDPRVVGEEIAEAQRTVAPGLFRGFSPVVVPADVDPGTDTHCAHVRDRRRDR